MNCTQFDEMLDLLMDDQLSSSDRQAMEAHAAGCPECAEKLAATVEIKELLAETAPEIDVPLEAQAAWRRAVKEEAGATRRRRLYRYFGGIAAAVIAVGGIGIALLNGPAAKAPMTAKNNMAFEEAAEEDAMAYEAMNEAAFDGEEVPPITFGSSPVAPAAGMVQADGLSGTAEPMPMPTMMPAYDAEPRMAAMEESIGSPAPMVEWTFYGCDIDRECAAMRDLIEEYDGTIDEQRFEADGHPCANLFIDLPADNAQEFMDTACMLHDDGRRPEDFGFDAYAGERVSILLVLTSAEAPAAIG